jgi:hypothetical protein
MVAALTLGQAFPLGQIVQDTAPAAAYSPVLHVTGLLAASGHFLPAGQVVQELDPSALYCPEEQAIGLVLLEQEKPAGHWMHEVRSLEA